MEKTSMAPLSAGKNEVATDPAYPNQEMLLRLLQVVEEDASISQRGLAQRLGIALGLTNGYLRWCAVKGFIKINSLSAKKYAYVLTPQGFVEKSTILGRHIQSSFALFRQAKEECQTLIKEFESKNIRKVILVGSGDLQDFAYMIGEESSVEFCKVKSIADIKGFDALLLTDMQVSQATYNKLLEKFPREKIFTLPLLKVHMGDL